MDGPNYGQQFPAPPKKTKDTTYDSSKSSISEHKTWNDMPTEIRQKIYQHLFRRFLWSPWDFKRLSPSYTIQPKRGFDPAILQADKRTSSEAHYIFYSENNFLIYVKGSKWIINDKDTSASGKDAFFESLLSFRHSTGFPFVSRITLMVEGSSESTQRLLTHVAKILTQCKGLRKVAICWRHYPRQIDDTWTREREIFRPLADLDRSCKLVGGLFEFEGWNTFPERMPVGTRLYPRRRYPTAGDLINFLESVREERLKEK